MSRSEQSRADAVADAETLRLYMRDGTLFNGVTQPPGYELRLFPDPGAGVRKHIRRGWADRAAAAAARAARFVFRAVPALRSAS